MKVLLATEGSIFSNAAIEKCCDLIKPMKGAEIRVLTVIEPAFVAAAQFATFPTYMSEVDETIRSAAERIASTANARILERIPSLGGGLSSKISVGLPKQLIVDEARDWGADLIVVGSHGSGFFGRALLGSVSDAVVNHAPCSVLVVRPPDHRF